MPSKQAIHLAFTRTFQPGDPQPDGYIHRQDWAQVQLKAGLKQVQCVECERWKFPQQLTKGKRVVCLECEGKGKP
jgi:hypothetical protein